MFSDPLVEYINELMRLMFESWKNQLETQWYRACVEKDVG